MKIAVIGLRGFPDVQGGIETHCEQLYPRLAHAGHEVYVYARNYYVNTHTKFEHAGCTIIPLCHFRKCALEAGFHTLLAILHAFIFVRPQIIHIHGIGPALMVPLARLLGMRVVVTHHGMDYERKKWGTGARKLLKLGEWVSLYTAQRMIAISHEIQQHLKKKRPSKEFHLIFNGVNLPVLIGKQQKTIQFESLGLEDKPYIFALGRFVPEKQFDLLIDAWKQLPKGTCNLVIAGCADHQSQFSMVLLKKAKEAGVVMPGFAKNGFLHDLFRFADLFAIPSSHEGLPIALLEAMSYNLKIVASDIAPHKEIQLNETSYFESGNVKQLTQMLLFNLKYNEYQGYRDQVVKHYNWDRIAEQTEKVYYEITKSNPTVIHSAGSMQY